jgi:hypothetical protein
MKNPAASYGVSDTGYLTAHYVRLVGERPKGQGIYPP